MLVLWMPLDNGTRHTVGVLIEEGKRLGKTIFGDCYLEEMYTHDQFDNFCGLS